jgi:putative ABC transport system permease protein
MDGKPFYSRSLLKIGWRFLRFHLWQSILMVLGISMGVAVAVGIDIANTSASRAFDISTEAIAGRATHYISGGSQGIEESLYVELKQAGMALPMAPIISDYLTSPDMDGITLQLFGIDPFSEAPFRNYLGGTEAVPLEGLTSFLSRPGSVLISQDLAARHAIDQNDQFEIEYAGRKIEVFVAGLLVPADSLTRRWMACCWWISLPHRRLPDVQAGLTGSISLSRMMPALKRSKACCPRVF